jgi:hypothetical protein
MPAYKLQGRTKFRGLDVSIENRKGSVRRWHDPHGKETGSTKMHASYGYIRKTKGTDGDHVDVYLGPHQDAPNVYIVDQMKKPEGSVKGDKKLWTTFDEQKVMLGYRSAHDAKQAYLKQYDDPRFFGSMRAMPYEQFEAKVLDKKNHGEKVAEEWGFLDNPHDPFHTPPTQRRAKTRESAMRYKKESALDVEAFAQEQGIKLAHAYWDGLDEMEKQAVISAIARGIGAAARGGARAAKAVRSGTAAAKAAPGAAAKKVRAAGQTVKHRAQEGYLRGRYGLGPEGAKAVRSERAGIRAADKSRAEMHKAMTPTRRPDPRLAAPKLQPVPAPPMTPAPAQPLSQVGAPAAGAGPYRTPAATPVAQGAPAAAPVAPTAQPTVAPPTPNPAAAAAEQAAPAAKPLLGAGNIARAGLLGVGGLGLYGGYQAINTAGNVMQHASQPASYYPTPGLGRPF